MTTDLSALQSQLAAQEATLKETTRQLAALREELDRRAAEPAPKPEVAPIKVGDLVVRTVRGGNTNRVTKDHVYRMDGWFDDQVGRTLYVLSDDLGRRDRFHAGYFRPADFASDRAAVEQCLLAEAARKGFKVGAFVKTHHRDHPYKVESLGVVWPGQQSSHLVQEAVKAAGQPVAVVGYTCFTVPATDPSILVKEEPITIEVAGQTYTADFSRSGIVTFGCAHIAVEQLRSAYTFLKGAHHGSAVVNRQIASVTIGRGVFDLPLLSRIVTRLEEAVASSEAT